MGLGFRQVRLTGTVECSLRIFDGGFRVVLLIDGHEWWWRRLVWPVLGLDRLGRWGQPHGVVRVIDVGRHGESSDA